MLLYNSVVENTGRVLTEALKEAVYPVQLDGFLTDYDKEVFFKKVFNNLF